MAEKPDSHPDDRRRNRRGSRVGAPNATAVREDSPRETVSCPSGHDLIEQMVERENMRSAYRRVVSNRGSAGVDGMTVEELGPYLVDHWSSIRVSLLSGEYRPCAVRQVSIPKSGGRGTRQLGIPTVLDRLVQQALHQVMTPLFDPDFSESSYGFRPGRSAHDAVLQAQSYVRAGRGWVVDIDLENFFDRVNHDILMSRVARVVKDKGALKLIRRFLQSGTMVGGVVHRRSEGTPQGGPLSPLLSNILLDDLDKELERRGHSFCRYADDCNIYVRSRVSGERVMASITGFLARHLRLRVNAEKSVVGRPRDRTFLGYSVTHYRDLRLIVAGSSLVRLRRRLKVLFRQGRGRRLTTTIELLNPVLRGWFQYFRLAESPVVFKSLDAWVRRRLRCVLWRQWKRPQTRLTALMRHGLDQTRSHPTAYSGGGPWWSAGAWATKLAVPPSYLHRLGLFSMLDEKLRLQRAS